MIDAKKNNAIQNALAVVYGQMFPGGKYEENILTIELYELFDRRISQKLVNQALRCVLSSIILLGIKSRRRIIEVMDKRFNSRLAREDEEVIVQFAVIHNRVAALVFENED